ncbi:MAG: V-type ATPase subunit [Candidatus Latescibacteria bacterium]|jgi:vacuolar-type H+-ATPase subunit C/Vma6|nr:V-type ATPase subunit [Candidatus Latescibacterota bacterium]
MIPVPFIEYVNVRIKGAHSRLFSRETYEDLMAGDNMGVLSTFLLDQPAYRDDVEKALEGLPEHEGLEHGVTNYFTRRVADVLHMTEGKTKRLFETALYSFDIKNLRALILAHNKGLMINEARDMFIPCGSLTMDKLSLMLSAPDLPGISMILSNCFPPGASALRKSINETSENEPIVIFINRFESNFYRHILKKLDRTDSDMAVLRKIFRLEIDIINIKSALKSVWERVLPGKEDISAFIRGGSVPVHFLEEMSRVNELEDAFEMIESTPFGPAVEKGIIYFAETGFFHEMERFFEEVFIRKALSYRRFDPFGVGVFIGYVWGLFVEMTNLRTLINGIAFRSGAGQMRKELIYV